MHKYRNAPTPLFEIGFKGYYRETSEHYVEHIRAKSQAEALKKFYRKYRLGRIPARQGKDATWWDGEWLMRFRYVRKVESTVCAHCSGSGIILD